jgi:hypothetical protein
MEPNLPPTRLKGIGLTRGSSKGVKNEKKIIRRDLNGNFGRFACVDYTSVSWKLLQ